MRERPIIFNSEMVRAVMEGRKVQMRQIIQERHLYRGRGPGNWPAHMPKGLEGERAIQWLTENCQYGAVGDRLWVRETFRVHSRATDVATLVYRASERQSWTQQTHRVPIEKCNKPAVVDKWTPSIHMPRWASRITLEITGVRVERLTALSDDDARNEGCPAQLPHNPEDKHQARTWFRGLWSEIYGEESWQANPFVWVIEFKRVEVE